MSDYSSTAVATAQCNSIRNVGKTYYQPGGNALVVSGKWTGRVAKNRLDDPFLMGRWTGITLLGPYDAKFSVIQTYQPVNTTMAGPHTSHSQQESIIASTATSGKQIVSPRSRYITDFRQFLQSLLNQKHHLIVMGDFNDDVSPSSRTPISRLFIDLNMVNLHSYRYPDLSLPRTYNRGSRTIDAIFGTPIVAKSVICGGFEPFQDHIPSDHRGLYVDIDMSKILGKTPIDLLGPKNRELRCRNPLQNPKYKDAVHKYFSDHNVDHRHSRLHNALKQCTPEESLPRDITILAERID